MSDPIKIVLPDMTNEITDVPPQSLEDLLRAGYLANAEESRKIAEEWRPLEVDVPD
jgi:hypothetical protein